MRVTTFIEPPAYEARVEVPIEDIVTALLDSEQCFGGEPRIFSLLNNMAKLFKHLEEPHIKNLTDPQREMIVRFLEEQLARFKEK